MNSILITGGSGFLGRALARQLLSSAQRICIFSRDEVKQHLMREEFQDPRLRYFIGDVRDTARLTHAMQGCDVVIHAAALKRVEVGEYDSAELVKTNVVGTMNVIEAATAAKVSRVVYVSSDKACEATNCYGASKFVGEKLILAANNSRGSHGPRFAAVRYGNVAGSTHSVIPTWRRALEQGRMVSLTHPDATRFWMTVQQAVDLVVGTAEQMGGGELEIPELPAYRLGDLAEAMGVTYHVTGLTPGEKLHESMRPGETSEMAQRLSVYELRGALNLV